MVSHYRTAIALQKYISLNEKSQKTLASVGGIDRRFDRIWFCRLGADSRSDGSEQQTVDRAHGGS